MGNTDLTVRIDKYLWSIRIFKTRSLASDACKNGKIKKEGVSLKPSYEVKIGDTYSIHKGIEKKIIKVIGIIGTRVDASKAVLNYQDLTPEPVAFEASTLVRDRGAGRPTKKDRREIENLLNNEL